MIDGFKGQKDIKKTPEDIDTKIKENLAEQRARNKMFKGEDEVDLEEESKIEDSKRKFAEKLRPNNRIWNFVDDSA